MHLACTDAPHLMLLIWSYERCSIGRGQGQERNDKHSKPVPLHYQTLRILRMLKDATCTVMVCYSHMNNYVIDFWSLRHVNLIVSLYAI